MAHWKWKETKQQPSMLSGPAVRGSCLVSFHILWAILTKSTVHYPSNEQSLISPGYQPPSFIHSLFHSCFSAEFTQVNPTPKNAAIGNGDVISNNYSRRRAVLFLYWAAPLKICIVRRSLLYYVYSV